MTSYTTRFKIPYHFHVYMSTLKTVRNYETGSMFILQVIPLECPEESLAEAKKMYSAIQSEYRRLHSQ